MTCPPTPDFAELIARLARTLGSREIPFMLIGGEEVPFATAEDLIVHKLFAGRPRDLEDVVGVLRRKGADLDWPYLRAWVGRFAEVPGREDLPARLERLREEGGLAG